jgi:hypothetical protein
VRYAAHRQSPLPLARPHLSGEVFPNPLPRSTRARAPAAALLRWETRAPASGQAPPRARPLATPIYRLPCATFGAAWPLLRVGPRVRLPCAATAPRRWSTPRQAHPPPSRTRSMQTAPHPDHAVSKAPTHASATPLASPAALERHWPPSRCHPSAGHLTVRLVSIESHGYKGTPVDLVRPPHRPNPLSHVDHFASPVFSLAALSQWLAPSCGGP